jgi:Domain of unknown function (DUF5667)
VSAVSTSVLPRRRAERFAELLDQKAPAGADSDRLHPHASGGGQVPGPGPRHRLRSRSDADLAALVTLSERAAAVRLKPSADPDPRFRADLRAMLVATVEREGIGEEPAERASRRLLVSPGSRARAAIVGGVVVGVLALSGIAAASGDAMPGDALYGVKRSTERAELAFAGSDAGRGQLYLEFARTRLGEAKSVSDNAGDFQRALADMDSDTRQGVKLLTGAAVQRKDPDTLDPVDTFVRAQQSDIGDLLDKVGGDSRARLLSSLDLLERVATRAQQLRQTLTCGTVPDDGSDALGPRPGSCSPAGKPNPTTPSGHGPARPSPSRGARGGTGPTAGPSAKPSAAATPSQPRTSGQPTPSPSASPDGDGGLLGGLRRIIGDLLGGG